MVAHGHAPLTDTSLGDQSVDIGFSKCDGREAKKCSGK